MMQTGGGKDNNNGGKDNNNMIHIILNAELYQIFELQSCIVCEKLSHKFTLPRSQPSLYRSDRLYGRKK